VLQAPQTDPVMGTSPCVDRQVSTRILGRVAVPEEPGTFETCPDGDIHGGVAVVVDDVPASGAPEDRFCPGAHAPTPGAYMGGTPRVDGFHEPVLLPPYALECHPELPVGHALGFSVASAVPARPVEMFEVLDGDVGVVFPGDGHDLVGDLPAPRGHEVVLVAAQPAQGLLARRLPLSARLRSLERRREMSRCFGPTS
jgi:hypothetical protein